MENGEGNNRMTADADRIETPRAFRAQAVLAGSGIDLSALGATDRTGGAPLVVELIGTLTGARLPDGTAAGGVAVLFRYGAVVFFDASSAGIADYLRQIGTHIRQPYPQGERETEMLDIRVDPAAKETIERNTLVLADVTLQKLQLVADIIAKSVSLAHHERNIERQFAAAARPGSCCSTWAVPCWRSIASWPGPGWTIRRNFSGIIRSWSGSGPA